MIAHSSFSSGPVLIGASFMTLMLSLEVCLRLYRANKREQDPELDNLTNPQVQVFILPNEAGIAEFYHFVIREK